MTRNFIILATALLALAACGDSNEARLLKGTCESVTRTFDLGDADHKRCLRDALYRKEMVTKRNSLMAQQYTAGHNAELGVMAITGDPEGYTRINTANELPVNGVMDISPEAAAAVGRKFVLRGSLSTLSDDDGGRKGKPTYALWGEPKGDASALYIIHSNALNEYQQAFIGKYCWLNNFRSSSLCAGDIFISIQFDPNLPRVVNAEIDGMSLQAGNEATVLTSITD